MVAERRQKEGPKQVSPTRGRDQISRIKFERGSRRFTPQRDKRSQKEKEVVSSSWKSRNISPTRRSLRLNPEIKTEDDYEFIPSAEIADFSECITVSTLSPTQTKSMENPSDFPTLTQSSGEKCCGCGRHSGCQTSHCLCKKTGKFCSKNACGQKCTNHSLKVNHVNSNDSARLSPNKATIDRNSLLERILSKSIHTRVKKQIHFH